MYDLQKQKQEMQQIIAAQEQELQRLHALLAKSVRPTQSSASNTQPLEAAEQHRRTGRSHASQDRIVQLELEVAMMKAQMSGLEKASETRVHHLEVQIEELEQELHDSMRNLEISEDLRYGVSHEHPLAISPTTHEDTMARCEAVMASLRASHLQMAQHSQAGARDECSTTQPCTPPKMEDILSARSHSAAPVRYRSLAEGVGTSRQTSFNEMLDSAAKDHAESRHQ
mmetsp:Transcript_10442/g.26769  ORF Transcript_10442/g.26769 Transcript_10442/m.26769 type:complete len:227 (-) Transcript_10442:68-748(-)